MKKEFVAIMFIAIVLLVISIQGCATMSMRCAYQSGVIGCPSPEEVAASHQEACLLLKDWKPGHWMVFSDGKLFERRYNTFEKNPGGYENGKYYKVVASPITGRAIPSKIPIQCR